MQKRQRLHHSWSPFRRPKLKRWAPDEVLETTLYYGSLGGSVDLEALCERPRVGGRLMYEPDQFPGAIYRMESPKVVFLIYSNGKIVCAGAKKEEEVYEAVENLCRRLGEIRVGLEPRLNERMT